MKYVKVSKSIYELVRALEEFEEQIEFTVFYSFAEILSSSHFCPAFTFNNIYYEIQYDSEDCLQVLDFGTNGWREEGEEIAEEYIKLLTESIRDEYKV